jgi:ribosomal protein L21E
MAKKQKRIIRVKPNSAKVVETVELCERLGKIIKAARKALVVELRKGAKPKKVVSYLHNVHWRIIVSVERIKKPR